MTDTNSSEDKFEIEAWLSQSLVQRRLIEDQVKLINDMLHSQEKFQKALQENAAAMAKTLSN